MNCKEHNDRSAVSTCAKCDAGLCNDCIIDSVFRNDNNQPFCRKCNQEIAYENDRLFHGALRSKMIIMCIYSVFVVIGVIYFIKSMIETKSEHIVACVLSMMLIWAFGSISNIFDRDSFIRRYLKKLVEFFGKQLSKEFPYNILGIPFFILGAILGFTFGGILSPIMIIMYLIGIGKVNKQIANNNTILSRFRAENSQN